MSLASPRAVWHSAPFEDLLGLRRLVLEPLLGVKDVTASLPLIRTCAAALGYELLGPAQLPDGGQAVVLRSKGTTGSIALLARLDKQTGLVVEAPLGTSQSLRSLALRLADRLHADAVLVGLDPEQGALGNTAFAEAHAAATWPADEHGSSIVLLRERELDVARSTSAELATWGGDASISLAERSVAGLEALGIDTTTAPIDLATAEQAGRSVFGSTALVAVTLDPRLLRTGALARSEGALEAFASLPVRDAECGQVAIELATALPVGAPAAPAALLDSARRAAIERSVVARRTLEDALATSSTQAAVVRASTGIFLVVVGRRERALVVGAFPLALALPNSEAPALASDSLAGCAEALVRGGTCRVMEPP
jgi:hypothetical protein